MRKAFTMIELIFVIVILGILAAVAVPKLAATRSDAEVSAKAHMIMTGATEIASFAVAKGYTEDDLSSMSNSITTLVDSGDAVLDVDNSKATVIVGSASECITIKITKNVSDDILSVLFGDTNGDAKCISLQSLINAADYPIKLRGQSIVY